MPKAKPVRATTKTIDPAAPTYPVGTIARLLILSDRRVQELVKEGVIPKSDHGRYELAPCVQGYIRYLQERSHKNTPVAGPDYHIEKSRLTKLQADKVQINNDRELSDLVNAAEVEREWSLVISDCKNRLLSIPSKMAPILAPITEPAQIMNVADDLIREALDELASYAERRTTTASGQDDSLAPTAKDDDQRLG